ncbi:hypothetical protein EJV47_02760 [Hymenobacter gummosus]|uniref:Outer membrane protein beta-barrel domain-containing protein n=1 Tax=Hymenobacter gummosus TaxID=1776032 RepID=A0A3S0ISD5_9BACT|nr:hypothetical protein [Hymenobacter gummosus]RTQ53675.1 hypothetical protein EJV47_02760 [Hymenobacter gummosus]
MPHSFLRRLPVLAALLLTLPAAAQKYRTALGVRLGSGNYGLTAQQKIFEKTTLEGIALLRSREVTGTVLIERHFPILGPSLNYYFGAGAHAGRHKDFGAVGGFDAMVGAEWKLPILPFVVAADFKPSFELNNDEWLRFPTAVSVRYVLIKEKTSFMGGIFERDKDKKRDKKKEKSRSGGGLFGN